MSRIEEIIRLEALVETSQWDVARLIWEELETGKTQRQLAEEIGKSLRHVQVMANTHKIVLDYPGSQDRPFHEAYAEAKRPKPKTDPEEKAQEAAETPQPDRSALEDINPEEVGSPSARLEEAKEQYIEVPKDKEPPSYKDLTKEQKKNRVAFNVLAGSINEGILALGEAMVQMGNDPEALEWAQEDIRTMKRRILALEEFYTTEMSN